MHKRVYVWMIPLLLILFSCSNNNPGLQNLHDLDANWKLSRLGSNEKYKVDIPSTVHSVLFNEEVINHPYSDDEEKNIKWIENEDWAYTTWFKTSDSWFDYDKIELLCDGLDTYAEIYLNEKEILKSNNMFRSWTVDLKPHLKSGRNELKIIFKSTVEQGNIAKNEQEYTLPTTDTDTINSVSSFVRKAPYHFGWDWAPRIISTGIWKDIQIKGWKYFKVENIEIEIKEINAEKATLSAKFDFESVDNGKVYMQLVSKQTEIKNNFEAYYLEPGKGSRSFDFEIKNPKLWWPNGMGEQFLYDLEFKFSTLPEMSDTYIENIKTGLRRIKLVQQRDSIGKTFQFNINNKNFFAKGANYIPQEVLLDRMTNQDYRDLLNTMKDSHFNMVRVWGGGIYERDIFYNLCDSLGIMVWQDFMFACAMYPGNEDFLLDINKEAMEQIKRLQNHSCMALWCGNNEVDVAWKNWGWQKQFEYTYAQESKIYRDYEVIFKEMFPQLVEEYDSDVPYVHTSPLSNWGTKENFNESSMHYWGVWHGEQAFENVYERVPRFMAEYGFQSFPSENTLKGFISPANMFLESATMTNRQKSYKGNGLIVDHVEDYFKTPDDFGDFIYKSQLTQAKFMNMAINAHRSANKKCAGTLYWQLNDCWPGPSWSTIDYDGKWKAAHYRVKDRYAPIILIAKQEGNRIQLSIDCDERKPTDVEVQLALKDFEGEILYRDTLSKTVFPDNANFLKEYTINHLVPSSKKNSMYLQLRLYSNGEIIDEELLYFNKEKYLELEPLDYTYSISTGDTIEVEIRSNTLAKNVELSFPMKGNFSNNYFDMEADSTYKVLFYPKAGEKLRTELGIRSLK